MASRFKYKKEVGWYTAIVIMMVFIGTSLVSLSNATSETAKETVEENFKNTVSETADLYASDFLTARDIVKSIATFLSRDSEAGEAEYGYATLSIKANTTAIASAVINTSGKGIDSREKTIDLSNTDFFSQLNEKEYFYYAFEDGITDVEETIVVSAPFYKGIALEGYVLAFIDASNFSNQSINNGFDKTSFYGLIDEKGVCCNSFGAKNPIVLEGDGIWSNLIGLCGDEETIRGIEEGSYEQTQLLHVNGKSDSKVYIIAPLNMDGWKMVVSISKNYFDILQKREWEQIRILCIEIGVGASAFFLALLGFNIFKNIKERENQEELEVKADTDLLTGLYNKIATEKLIKNYIAQNPETQCLFIILDLDNFKNINDTLGHTFGDEVLHYLGMRLSSQFRVTDIVGRVGGDEFMIFLKNMKSQEDIEAEARKMSHFFNNFQVGEYTKFYATASMGAAVFPRDAKTFEGLYKAADNALYKAKKNGKKQMAFFSKDN